MARRLTTNQEIAGSIPASIKMIPPSKVFLFCPSFGKLSGPKFLFSWKVLWVFVAGWDFHLTFRVHVEGSASHRRDIARGSFEVSWISKCNDEVFRYDSSFTWFGVIGTKHFISCQNIVSRMSRVWRDPVAWLMSKSARELKCPLAPSVQTAKHPEYTETYSSSHRMIRNH